jgi:phosphoesterase RecJ-like protein
MEVGALLVSNGATAETIVKPIYRTRPLAQVRFQAAVISNAQTACNGRLIWSYATDETLAATGAGPEMDDNFSGILRDIEGVQIAAFFKNYGEPALTRLSLRSEAPYNAAAFCQRFGGGGHARAAGAALNMPIAEAMAVVVAELEKELSQR